jgi:hypothetical protein
LAKGAKDMLGRRRAISWVAVLPLFCLNVISQDYKNQVDLIEAVAPIFPQDAWASNTSAIMKIEVSVDSSGKVMKAQDIGDNIYTYKMFGSASEEAAKRWRFIPDHAVAIRKYVITFIYKIMPLDASMEDLTGSYRPPYEMEVRCRRREPIVFDDPPNVGKRR